MIPSTPDILARLIAEPTVSRASNLALLDYVEELLRPVGARIERFSHPDGSRANLWATIGPDGPDGVVLSGHTDVVPTEGQNWSTDPNSRGAFPRPQPGYFTRIAHAEAGAVDNLLFAGDHTSSFYEWQGFMEGAVLSGLRAASEASTLFRGG